VVESFGIVVMVVAVLGAVVAAVSYLGSGSIYRGLGRGGLSLDEPGLRKDPAPGSSAWQADADMELRQLLEAKAARAEARGEEPIDVDVELARMRELMSGADPELRAEVREMVIASNERRARRRQPLLDVDGEVERRLQDAGGL
jgi:hypothetical protein